MNQNFNTLDEILSELKKILQPLQKEIEPEFEKSNFPFGFIVGNPRSGTTVFLQYLASLGCFSYPTNVLARFAYAPYYGALIQQMLFNKEFDPLGELDSIDSSITFKSSLGKNKGLLGPNEFQHFFRNYTTNFFPEYIKKEAFNLIDFQSLKNGLNSIESVFNQPFVTKAMMFQYNLADFYKHVPNGIFFYMKRDPLYVMQSIFLARQKYFGDVNNWWSVKPKEFNFLKDMDIYHQIAGQVYFTDKSIESNFDLIPEYNKLIIQYEDFCENPSIYFDKIKLIYLRYKTNIIIKNISNISFKNTNSLIISKVEFDKLATAYNYFKLQ